MSDDSTTPGPGPADVPADSDSIKVTDRRKFDRSGRLRDDAPQEAPQEARESSHGPAGTASRAKGDAGSTPPRKSDATGGPHVGAAPGGDAAGKERGVDFQSFVYFLYMSALHELGAPVEPGAPARAADLDRARFFVEVLQVLEEKTQGNLNAGERRMLEEALYNLRMQYVGVSRKTS